MPPVKKNLKATKKFEKKHLKGVLDQRKASAKVKQRQQLKNKKQTRRSKDAEFYKKGEAGDGTAAAAATVPNGKGKKDAHVSEMSVDDFFAGGFEGLAAPADKKSKKGKLGKRKREEAGRENGEADEDEDEDEDGSDGSFDEFGVEEMPVESDVGEEDGADDDIGMSKKTMDELAEKDPEFYKFLKETDPEALDFDENADLAEIDALSEEEAEAEEEQPKKKRKKESAKETQKNAQTEVTSEMVAKWKASMMETNSLRAAREVVVAFRSAVHLNDAADPDHKERFSINSPQVYNDIVLTALKHIPEVMQHHVPVKESSSGKLYVQNESKKFKTLSVMIKTYTASIMHLLGTLADDKTRKLTISSLEPLVPYLLSFRKLLKALIKTVVRHWALVSSSEATKIAAFLILRRLVVVGDGGIREIVLKTTYQGLIGSCRVTNHNTLSGINILKNTAAELWGIDPSIGYTTAFTFIRQLAIHLRNAIVKTQKRKDVYRIVYNWQYTHSLDFWSIVLSEHCNPMKEAEAGKENQLRLLIYPLVQVTLGAMRLIPSATYFPLRFHLIRSCLRISRSTGTYIPLASPLLEVLNAKEMRHPAKPSNLREAHDFAVSYRAPDSVLRTRSYQDGVGDQVVELLADFFLLWATNIAFPELCLPVVIQLKRWLKQARGRATGNRNAKLTSGLVVLVQKLEANAKFVEQKREKVDFAPRDRAQVDAFLRDFDWEKTPLGAYVSAQRKMRSEKAKLVAEARKEDERRREEEKKGGGEEVEVEDEDEDVDEMEVDGEEEDDDDDDDVSDSDDGEGEEEDESD